jgi:hypothetical protein
MGACHQGEADHDSMIGLRPNMKVSPMVQQPEQLAIVVLSGSRPPDVRSSTVPIGGTIEIPGVTFRDSGVGDWLGFYDWLRTSDSQIIGVHVILDEAIDRLLQLKALNVEIDQTRRKILIFFRPSGL